jgi:predicted polyphosphate/ATP-dependent NAD kinase
MSKCLTCPEYSNLLEIKDRLHLERVVLEKEISDIKNQQYKRGSKNKDWFIQAETAKKAKIIRLSQIMMEIRNINKLSERKLKNELFTRYFTDIAEIVLTPEVFEKLKELTWFISDNTSEPIKKQEIFIGLLKNKFDIENAKPIIQDTYDFKKIQKLMEERKAVEPV